MFRCLATYFCLSSLLIVAPIPPILAEIPTPESAVPFALPLSDKSMAQAVLLPTDAGGLWMVYSTPTGQIGFWVLTPTACPIPTPPPSPPVPPVPPVPPDPVCLSVVVVTSSTPDVLRPEVLDFLRSQKIPFSLFTESMVSEKYPPADALFFIGRSAVTGTPALFICSGSRTILWEGPRPSSPSTFIGLIQKYLDSASSPSDCVGGNCPIKRRKFK